MRNAILLGLILAAACGDNGANDTDGPGAPADAAPDTPIDAAPMPTALAHTLFLATEGVDMSPGGDDATTNTTSIAAHAATVGPYLANDAARTTKIAALVTDLQGVVAPYDITVTTTRPAAGPYTMIVITDDTSTALVGTGGVEFVVPQICTPAHEGASEVAFEFTAGPRTAYTVEQQALAMFASLQQIPATTRAGDCMLWSGASLSAICTIGGAGTQTDSQPNCAGASTIDEGAQFLATFGAHP